MLADVLGLARSHVAEIVEENTRRVGHSMGPRADESAPCVPIFPPNANRLTRHRCRRDLVIHVAYRGRVSQRVLADVFGLARSRVAAILAKSREIYPDCRGKT